MIDHLSFSSISRYLKCGKQWQKKYLEKLPEGKSDAKEFGRAWHYMTREKIVTSKPLEDCWLTAIEQEPVSEEMFLLGNKMLTSPGITQAIQGLSVKPESLEMETELHIPGVSVPTIGFIDMIQNDGTPIDIKTASRKWTQEQADTSLQATFYLAALEQLQMVKLPAKFKFVVFTKTKNPTVQILETTRTHEDVFALYGLIGEVWQAIQREVFTPTDPGNWWCSPKYCGFWDVCEYGGKNGR